MTVQHSVLEPAGPHAALIRDALWHPMYVAALVTFALVVAALVWAVVRRRGNERSDDGRR